MVSERNRAIVCILATALVTGALAGCTEDPAPGSGPDSGNISAISFGMAARDVLAGSAISVNPLVTSDGVTEPMDICGADLKLYSTDGSVATVDSKGLVKAVSTGECEIVASARNGKSARLRLRVIDTGVLSSAITPGMIYTSGRQLPDNSVMQSFDFGEDSYLYFMQVGRGGNNFNNVLSHRMKDGTAYEIMHLSYFGHGQNMAAEVLNGTTRCWVPCYGTKQSDGDYTNAQTIARIKFEPGVTMTAKDTGEDYWIPGARNLQVALDIPNDMLLMYTVQSDGKAHYYVYRLSEAKKLTAAEKKLSYNIVWGGESGGPKKVSETPVVMVKDLSELEPLHHFQGPSGKQGYEISNGFIYTYAGAGNDNDGVSKSSCTVTVMDLSGSTKKQHTVEGILDLQNLNALGLTSTGYMEAESMKVRNGKAYLGFASKDKDDVRRAVILEYDLMKQ